MNWFDSRRVALAAVVAVFWIGESSAAAASAHDPEVQRWFDRHPDSLWRPLAEKWAASKAAMTSPVVNLTLPLDYYENGRVRAVLKAGRSQMYEDGLIFAENVSIDMLTADGMPDGRLTAENCLFDRQAKHGYCEGSVWMVKGADRLKGRGMYFSIGNQFIKILSECEIRTNRIPLKFGRFS